MPQIGAQIGSQIVSKIGSKMGFLICLPDWSPAEWFSDVDNRYWHPDGGAKEWLLDVAAQIGSLMASQDWIADKYPRLAHRVALKLFLRLAPKWWFLRCLPD